MTTQAEFLDRVRNERLNEASPRQFTDQNIRQWINEAARDIARKTESLQDRDTIAAVVGQSEYSFGTDAIRIFRVEFTPTGERTRPLEYVDVKSLDNYGWDQRDRTDSYPQLFTVWGSGRTLKLITFPSPSQAGSFTVWFYKVPVDLEVTTNADGNEQVEIPGNWDDIVLDYVEYRALRKDRDPRWTEAKALYDENLASMYDNTRRWVDSAGMITPETGSLPAWLTSFS